MVTHFTFKAIGTTWNIDIYNTVSDSVDGTDNRDREHLLKIIIDRVELFESMYSRFRPESIITQISKQAGEYIFTDDAKPILDMYEVLYKITSGLMTPLIGQVLSDTGYDSQYSLAPKYVIAPAKSWEDVLRYRFPKLTVTEPVLLDFGAIGKGYAIDMVGEILKSAGYNDYMVEAGGDLLCRRAETLSAPDSISLAKKFRIGLEHPNSAEQVIGTAEIMNLSLCGSAGNRRAWRGYTHILNPKTVQSPKHITGLWTTAKTTLLADALTTALFFIEPEVLKAEFDFEYAIVYADNSLKVSQGFPAEFF